MIHDTLENLHRYLPKKYKEDIISFLNSVNENMEERKYDICSDAVYANIMSYPTKAIDDCTIEAHDTYCDIQFSIVGSEQISLFKREDLNEKTFEAENDFHTFVVNQDAYWGTVINKVGYFAIIHTDEAHRPQETADGTCAVVKKGVIKIKEALFNE